MVSLEVRKRVRKQPQPELSREVRKSPCLPLAEPTKGGRRSPLIRKWEGKGREWHQGQKACAEHHNPRSIYSAHSYMPLKWRNLPFQHRADANVHWGPGSFLIMGRETKETITWQKMWLPHFLQEDTWPRMPTRACFSHQTSVPPSCYANAVVAFT